MTLIAAEQLRGITHDVTITNAAGATITPGDNDEIRAIICRLSELGGTAQTPTGAQLVVTSEAATANGSSFTKNSPSSGVNRLRLDAEDLATISPGVYSLVIDYFDRADASEWKTVSTQVLVLGER